MPRQLVRDFKTCLSFNGTSNKATVAVPSTAIDNITYSLWVKANIVTATERIVTNGDNTANGFAPSIAADGTIYTELLGIVNVSTGQKIIPGVWTFLTYTRTSGVSQMYINGVAQGITYNNTPIAPTGFLCAGGSVNGSNAGFGSGYAGLIDDVRIYERPLSATEILNFYYGSEPASTSLKIKWLMDEGSGTSLIDASGNGNTGTISGATYSTDVFMKARTVAS